MITIHFCPNCGCPVAIEATQCQNCNSALEDDEIIRGTFFERDAEKLIAVWGLDK